MGTQDKIEVMIHGRQTLDEAYAVKDTDAFHCMAKYSGKYYRTIFNPFSLPYYMDNRYGEVTADEWEG